MATSEPQLDIIVLTHGRLELTIRCVKALFQHTKVPFHLIVMDDSSPDMDEGTDLTPLWFDKFCATHSNVTYAHSDVPFKSSLEIFKLAFPYCKTEYVTVVVNSMVVEPEWEFASLQLMQQNPVIGMMGFKAVRMGTQLIESAGLATTKDGSTLSDMGRGQASHRHSKVYECDAVQWAFVLLRLEAVKDNLGEDIYHGFKGWEEFETCFTMREKGWKIFYCGLSVGYHQTLATRIAASPEDITKNLQNREIFTKRWGFWKLYRKYNAVGEFYPKMKPRKNLTIQPVMLIDHTGLATQVPEVVRGGKEDAE